MLRVQEGRLYNDDAPIVLRGLSSHGLQWYGDFCTQANLEFFVKTWGINCFRAAMYTDEGGYLTNHRIAEKVSEIVDICTKLGIYCLIDWHILYDNDPLIHLDQAAKFFTKMATLYADNPRVIYEICNEPNGATVTWSQHIKPYAEHIIPLIRELAPQAVIIVGNPDYSSRPDVAINDPLNFENIMYSFHYYPRTEPYSDADTPRNANKWNVLKKCVKAKLPIFVTEFGVGDSGGEKLYAKKAAEFVKFLETNQISYLHWALSNSGDTLGILKPEVQPGDQLTAASFSPSGVALKQILTTPNPL